MTTRPWMPARSACSGYRGKQPAPTMPPTSVGGAAAVGGGAGAGGPNRAAASGVRKVSTRS